LKLPKQAAEITFVNGGKRERSRPRNEVTKFLIGLYKDEFLRKKLVKTGSGWA
jgi:hypothetical protein